MNLTSIFQWYNILQSLNDINASLEKCDDTDLATYADNADG